MSQALSGRRIVVTRARHQAGRLTAQLQSLGAEVLEIPAVEVAPPESFAPLDEALRAVGRYGWLILTSANTVRTLKERMQALGIQPAAFAHLRVAAVGASTADAARDAGFPVTLVPEKYVAESLAELLKDRIAGERVLLARAAVARDVIPDELRRQGATVDIVDAYRTILPRDSVAALEAAFADPARLPDAATFTSSSTVHNFLELLHAAGIAAVPPRLRAISIGPITSATLREHHWQPAAEADPSDLDGLVQAVLRALAEEPSAR